MQGVKKIFQFLILGIVIFSINQPLKDYIALAQNINSDISDCSAKPHTYDFKFETMTSTIKTLSGEINNILHKKKDRLYNIAFLSSNFDDSQPQTIYFLLSQDNIEIEGNLIFTGNKNNEIKGSFIPFKKDQSNLQITYTTADHQVRRISNSGHFKLTNLKINESESNLIVPVSFNMEFDGEFTCPTNKFEINQLLGITGFIEVNPIEESLIAIR